MSRFIPHVAATIAVALLIGFTTVAEAQIPTPEEVIGFEPGEDYRLADNSQLETYYRQLAEASDRIDLRVIGETVQGRDLLLLEISSSENLANRDQYREISERLARAEDLSDEEARELAEEGKSVVWIDNGLHSTERAHAQHGPHLAYHMATDESAESQRIRDNVILLMMPVMNPDGQDIIVDWWREQRDTPFAETSPPQVYHEYIGHDNNRDWYMLLQEESKAVANELYYEWYPQIVVNHHQMGEMPARMFIPPYEDPVNPNMPSLAVQGTNLVGSHMANRFSEEGKSGIVHRITFNLWWNGGMRTAPMFHNMIGILTESTHRSPIPRYWDEDDISDSIVRGGREIPMNEPSVNYPDPWEGGWSSLGQMVDYHMTASMGVLDIAEKKKHEFLYNIYQMGRDQIEAGEEEGPYAFVIPEDQWDMPETVEMLNVLHRGGLDIHQANQSFTADGQQFEAGSYIVYSSQAFRGHVLDMLDEQVYPERTLYPGGPPEPPYDMAGWTLPYQMGVETHRIEEPFEAAAEKIDGPVQRPEGTAAEGAYGYALSPRSTFGTRAAIRLLEEGHAVSRAASSFGAGQDEHDAGTFVIEAGGQATSTMVSELSEELGVDFTGLEQEPNVDLYEISMPNIGMYKPWTGNIDEGWTRWIFDNYDVPVTSLRDDDIQNGDLSQYDILILPAQSPNSMLRGHSPGSMPDEYVGGLGTEGATAIKRYAEAGGTVLAWDGSTDFLIEQFGLPVRSRVGNVSRSNFFIPGSIVGIQVDNDHPIGFGMQPETGAFFVDRRGSQSRSFRILEGRSVEGPESEHRAPNPPVEPFAWFADEDVLLSGWARGEERYLAGEPAAVRVQMGEGQAILLGVRAQFRAQPRATFPFIFNAIHASTSDDIPAVEPPPVEADDDE